jgi:hypothetical protein
MTNVAELTTENAQTASEILFLKKEIDFLMKLLRNGYSSTVTIEKIRLLDKYWKGFEDNIGRLDSLLFRITMEENMPSILSQNNTDENLTLSNKESFTEEFSLINNSVKALKESFYEYMSGCCACSKKNQ